MHLTNDTFGRIVQSCHYSTGSVEPVCCIVRNAAQLGRVLRHPQPLINLVARNLLGLCSHGRSFVIYAPCHRYTLCNTLKLIRNKVQRRCRICPSNAVVMTAGCAGSFMLSVTFAVFLQCTPPRCKVNMTGDSPPRCKVTVTGATGVYRRQYR